MKQKLLLTGSSGFLGQNIMRVLESGSKFEVTALSHKQCDLTKLENAEKACKNIDVVIHAAGLVLSRVEQQARPAEVLFQNLSTTLNIAEAARLQKVKKLIFISSVTAYGTLAKPPLKEEDLWAGAPALGSFSYGTAKRMMQPVAAAYFAQYGIKSSSVIFPNLYGPGDKFNFNPPPLVANAISQIWQAKKQGQKEFLAGNNGNQYIDLLYIEDAAKAVNKILQKAELPELLNIGTGATIPISEVFKLIAQNLSYTGKIVWHNTSAKAQARSLNVSKMKKLLNWSPETSLKRGLELTVKWYLNNHKI